MVLDIHSYIVFSYLFLQYIITQSFPQDIFTYAYAALNSVAYITAISMLQLNVFYTPRLSNIAKILISGATTLLVLGLIIVLCNKSINNYYNHY